jgi:sulfur-oxidizing protein SoxY
MSTRREVLSRSAQVAAMLATLGAWPAQADVPGWPAAAFDATTLAEVIKALGAGAPQESKDVSLSGPDIAENGAAVPITVATTLPDVKRLLVLVEKNPAALSAIFELGDMVEPQIATRVKMAQSSNVVAVAITADARVLYAVKEIRVTLGGCGA